MFHGCCSLPYPLGGPFSRVQRLDIPTAEVAVHWHEVDGSKLIQSKLDVVTTSLTMLRDMVCVRLCYELGVWRAIAPPSP